MTEHPTKGELTKAVCAVMSELQRVAKGDENKHGGYKYASVDDMKDGLRPLLAKHGLEVRITESGWSIEQLTTKSGTQVAARFVFDITLRHISGAQDEPERTTVLLPHTGAQTTGAAKSYALKEWLKGRFLVSTGEQDEADSSAPQDYTAAEQPKTIDAAQFRELRDLIDATKSDEMKLLAYVKCDDLHNLTQAQYTIAKAALQKKTAQKAAA